MRCFNKYYHFQIKYVYSSNMVIFILCYIFYDYIIYNIEIVGTVLLYIVNNQFTAE